jgi:hypothetical protein
VIEKKTLTMLGDELTMFSTQLHTLIVVAVVFILVSLVSCRLLEPGRNVYVFVLCFHPGAFVKAYHRVKVVLCLIKPAPTRHPFLGDDVYDRLEMASSN